MPRIEYQDLRYAREELFYSKVFPNFQKILKDFPELNKDAFIREDKFYHLIGRAIQVDSHYMVKNIIRQINRYLKTNFNIKIFVYQADTYHAYCSPRSTYGKNKAGIEEDLIILVSQHFFNGLGEYERVPVIAHELAHMVYRHVEIPVERIIKQKFNIDYIENFKADLLKWSLCREITADIFALIASDFNHNIVCRSLLKFTTGLNDIYGDDMITMALQQYDTIAEAVYHEEVTTHPLMPMRMKIINEIIETDLIKNYGRTISQKQKDKYLHDFNQCIDSVIHTIYPEVVGNQELDANEIIFNMSVAVALSDGHISPEEVIAVSNISNFPISETLAKRLNKLAETGRHEKQIANYILKSVALVKSGDYRRDEIVQIIRRLFLIAISDGHVDKNELLTIYEFAKHFDLSKVDIVLMLTSLRMN